MGESSSERAAARVLVWDLPLRACHWLLALAVTGSFLSQWLDWPFAWHEACGYAVWVLVVFRLVWGFVGARHARFADFVRGPHAVQAYLRGLRAGSAMHPAGHNPLGGWMILIMLATLAGQATCGLFANDTISATGPLFGYLTQSGSDRLTHWHHRLAVAIETLVIVHVAAVLAYRWIRHDDLVAAMLHGYRSGLVSAEAVTSERRLLALALVLAAACVLAALVLTAPQASLVLI